MPVKGHAASPAAWAAPNPRTTGIKPLPKAALGSKQTSGPRFRTINKFLNLENKFNASRGKKEVEENKRKRLVSLPKSENEYIPVPAYARLQTDKETACAELHLHGCMHLRIPPHHRVDSLTHHSEPRQEGLWCHLGYPVLKLPHCVGSPGPRMGAAPRHERRRHTRAERHQDAGLRFPTEEGELGRSVLSDPTSRDRAMFRVPLARH